VIFLKIKTMKPVMKQMKHIKINGHGCRKGRVWNMASFLTRRQRLALALKSASPDAATDSPAPAPNPTPTQPETPPGVCDLGAPGVNPTPQPEPVPSPLCDLHASAVNPSPQPETPSLCDLSAFAVNLNPTPRRETLPGPPRNGKIAHLPEDIRDKVNQMLRSGQPYSDICQTLATLGHPGINGPNISHWKYGGFVDWLAEEQRSESRLVSARALDRCTRSVDLDRMQQNTISLAAHKLAVIILNFDQDRALDLLSRQPELFPKFVAAISTLSKSSVDLAKAFDIAHARETALRAQIPNSSPLPNGDIVADGETSATDVKPVLSLVKPG
jgi:hypothetical protein